MSLIGSLCSVQICWGFPCLKINICDRCVTSVDKFSKCFAHWVSVITELSEGKVIAVDGKCLRGSRGRASSKSAIYMVSAWATKNQLVLGQQKIDDKSNEINAIPKLLMKLNISGAFITMDAMALPIKMAQYSASWI
ncbi:MAG: ISAs1 family transposase [Ghiorsea sp.]|nr:ISAs1 family transposase [Ghiorsea sp.]